MCVLRLLHCWDLAGSTGEAALVRLATWHVPHLVLPPSLLWRLFLVQYRLAFATWLSPPVSTPHAEVGGIRECLRFPDNAEFHPLMYLEVGEGAGQIKKCRPMQSCFCKQSGATASSTR